MSKRFIVTAVGIRDLTAKNRLTRSLTLAALIACAPGIAGAQDGWYARADLGYGFGGSADISAGAPIGGDVSVEGGLAGSAGIGYALGNGWRIEGELGRRQNDLEAAPLLDPGGEISATTLMANAYVDIGDSDGAFTPYLGAGFGAAAVQLRAAFTPPLSPVAVHDGATVVAYQIMAGVAIGLGPNLDLDLGYRYFAAPSIELTGAAPPTLSIPVDVDLTHHAVTAGLRWSF